MFTGFVGSSPQQQLLEKNDTQQTVAAASSTPGAAAVTTPAASLGQGTSGQVCSTPTPPVGVALGVASVGGLLPPPANGWYYIHTSAMSVSLTWCLLHYTHNCLFSYICP